MTANRLVATARRRAGVAFGRAAQERRHPIDEQIAHRRFEPCVGLAAWANMQSPSQILVRSWQRQPLDMGGSIESK